MLLRLFSLLSLGVGIFVMVQVVMPMVMYKVWEVAFYNENTLLADPTPTLITPAFSSEAGVAGVSISNHGNFPALVSNKTRDVAPPYSEFSLSIPKINIKHAKVVVDSNEFDDHLAQLPDSALPGERGNVFITGHSSLAQFFTQENYKAIFANLPSLKKGDEINITAMGVNYKYIVEGLRIVEPTEVWVVNPPDTVGRYLSLMTCVPPGLNTKRLVVLARLQ